MFTGTLRQARSLVVTVVGFTVVAAGVTMLVLPGPGMLTIALGLGILGAEFVWARRLLRRIKQAGTQVSDSFFGAGRARAKPTGGKNQPPA